MRMCVRLHLMPALSSHTIEMSWNWFHDKKTTDETRMSADRDLYAFLLKLEKILILVYISFLSNAGSGGDPVIGSSEQR